MNKLISIRNNKLNISFLTSKKTIYITVILSLIVFMVFVLSVGMGTLNIHPVNVIKVLFGFGSQQDTTIITTFRLPRVIVALLVGASLSVSGAILQGIIRNPLASPDIIGITGGASVAAVAFITIFKSVSIHWLPVSAFIGAAVITIFIYILAWKQGVTPLRFVLIGIGVGSAMSALTTLLIVMTPINLSSKALIWLTGTVYGSSWNNVFTLFTWTLILMPLAFIFGRSIDAQQLGDDVATGIGNPIQLHRLILLLICAALAGSAVAIGGAIGFVGLIAPHIARKLVGPAFGGLLSSSALIGAVIVMLGDLVGRTAFPPLDLPVGIFTSAIGAPFFIYLLYRNRNQ